MSFNFYLHIETDEDPDVEWAVAEALEAVSAWLRQRGGDGPGLADAIDRRDHLRPVQRRVFAANYTYNVSPMLFRAFASCGHDQGVRSLDGMRADDAETLLAGVLAYFETHREALEALNPENGWGSYDGIVLLLLSMRTASIEHPSGVWGVS